MAPAPAPPPTAAPRDRANVAADADTIEVTWTSNQNAEYLRAEFAPMEGDPVTKRLEEVGKTASYEGTDGADVRVRVTAPAGDERTVILDRSVSL